MTVYEELVERDVYKRQVFNSSGVSTIQTWLLGSLVNVTWADFRILACYTVAGLVL